ncbi:MAG: single-stranded-DNA-specific exonuclease RecJ [Patescibacteria group bacterium]
MPMQKQWLVAELCPATFRLEHPELPDIVLQLLWNRAMRTQRDIDTFLNPDYGRDTHDPFLFRDMQKAVDRLFQAIANQEKIVIHGDYDADGVSASVILSATLGALGAVTDIFLPHREMDGYGLNLKNVEKIAAGGARVIITCDCGISNAAEITRAKALGIDVIITDHHQEPKELPVDALAIIHPKIEGETYPCKTLAGGGVAFKLAQALLKTHAQHVDQLPNGESHSVFEKWLLDMVAISCVADMVPLLGETRTLVKYGLIVLEKTRRVGLQRLMKEAGLFNHDGTLRRTAISAADIGFKIAPRINAAGRMHHATAAFNLLVEEDEENARIMAEEINRNNTARQELTADLTERARAIIAETHQTNDPLIVVVGHGWSPGIIGLIASRIKDEYYKPVIVLAEKDGVHVGSGRSTSGFNMIQGLQQIPELFVKFGGHPQACGFTLAASPAELKTALTRIIEMQETDDTPTLPVDAEVDLEAVTWDLYDLLERFHPFGIGNPEPCFVARDCEVVHVEPVGVDGKHRRLHVRHRTSMIRKTIGFNCAEWCPALVAGDHLDMVFEVGVNEWNGNRELQLKMTDVRLTTTRALMPMPIAAPVTVPDTTIL